MRTTIRLDDEILGQVKEIAARSDTTVTAIIEDALREMLARRRRTPTRGPIALSTVTGDGIQSGVDLDDSAALLSLMEEADDPA